MTGILVLIAYLLCGIAAAYALFSRKSGLIHLWIGLCAGLMMMMWLPMCFAFFVDFTKKAQLLGLAAAVLIAGSLILLNRKKICVSRSFAGDMPLWLLLTLVVPLTILSGYLQYTHTLREVGGALHVGQSTYGDLCLHLGIATGMQNAACPPDYTILPGAMLGYPFLSDSMVSTMLLFGSGLSLSFIVTGTLMMLLVYTGFVIFAWELTRSKAAVILSFIFMFINGGLGFLYTFDGVFKDPSMLREVFTGFYKTPTNMPDLNLRWVNVICDMMVPQRTLLAGWCMLLPALYMLTNAVREKQRRSFLLLGIWAGLMPMVHTHSFFALGLMSIGVMAHRIFTAEKSERKDSLLNFLIYGITAVILALPQLLTWTFPQTVDGGSLAFRFNWVNNQGNGQLIDGYFWFWIKNVGILYILMVPAALSTKRGSMQKSLAIGALIIYAVAECIQFQPNPYDNNKLFYVAYMLMLPAAAEYLIRLWKKLRGIPGRGLFAALLIGACTVSGTLSIAREVISDYQLFSADEVRAADFIRENTDKDAVFLTGQQHNNAVAALTGRYIVCGTGSYLYYHGIDYSDQQAAEYLMLTEPGNHAFLFDEYNVDYIYISSIERNNFDVDEDWFSENTQLIYDAGGVRIYSRAVPQE